MSPLNTLAGGYKGGSPRVRSSNNRAPVIDTKPKVDYKGLTDKIKAWHADGVLTNEDVNYIISQLQTIV